MRRSLALVILLLSSAILIGCWDRVELEERAFIMTIGIDLVKAEKTEPLEDTGVWQEEPPPQAAELPSARKEVRQGGDVTGLPATPIPGPGKEKMYKVTVEIANPGAMGGDQGGGGGGGGASAPANWVLSTTGDTISEAISELATRTGRRPYLGHLMMIVVGEDAAREGLGGVIDFFVRSGEVTRTAKFMVAAGEAADVLKVKPKLDRLIAVYLERTLQSREVTSRFRERDLNRLLRDLRFDNATLVARVTPFEEEAKVAGAGIIAGNRLVGYLGEAETRAALLILGELAGGTLVIPCPDEDGGRVTYLLDEATRTIRPEWREDHLHFSVEIEMSGRVAERTCPSPINPQFLAKVGEGVAAQVEREVTFVLKKLQRDFGADVLQLGEELWRRDPKLWRRIDWRQEFPRATFDIKVKVKVTAYGQST